MRYSAEAGHAIKNKPPLKRCCKKFCVHYRDGGSRGTNHEEHSTGQWHQQLKASPLVKLQEVEFKSLRKIHHTAMVSQQFKCET